MTKKQRQSLSQDNLPTHVSSATLLLLIFTAALGTLYYGLFLFNPHSRGDYLPYLLVIGSESFIMLQALVAYWTILAGSYNPRNYIYSQARHNLFRSSVIKGSTVPITVQPKVIINSKVATIDVFVTVYGEPLDVIRRTATAARDIVGNHTTYLLDDGDSDAVKSLAATLGICYLRRREHTGAKAGNINHALSKTAADYFVIFDADHVPKPQFLHETMPFFADSKVAFVQTPQSYNNLHNPISRGAGHAQQLFYRFICTGKNRFNAAFCVGTNVVFRRTAINAINGIYEASNSEDIWTSLLLHEQGFRSVYIPNILAVGEAPDTISAYSKQQLRWATGGFEILLTGRPLKRNLSIDQKIQYISTALYYMLGLSTALLFSLPPIAIFTHQTPILGDISQASWLGHYLAFYGLQLMVASYCMNGFKLETLILSTGTFPTYLKALGNVLRKKQLGWRATGQKTNDSPYEYIYPQVLLFVFLLFTSGVGLVNLFSNEGVSIVALSANLLNTYIIGSYISFALSYNNQPALESSDQSRLKLEIRETVSG